LIRHGETKSGEDMSKLGCVYEGDFLLFTHGKSPLRIPPFGRICVLFSKHLTSKSEKTTSHRELDDFHQ